MIEITDDMCRRAVEAMKPDRIQGFSTPHDSPGGRTWGAPHYVRDVLAPPGEQILWTGDSAEEMQEHCQIEEMRLALRAAYGEAPR